MIVFRNGPDAELGYIKHAFVGAFQRHLGRGPSRGDPEAWVGRTSKREAAEAVASELAAIDAQPRDSAFATVFEIHEL